MKKLIIFFILGIFLVSFVSAEFLTIFTGRVVEEMGETFYDLPKDEIIHLYEENKDKIPKDEVIQIYEENKEYLGDLDFELDGLTAEVGGLEFDLGVLTCGLMKTFLKEEIIGLEIPKEVPFKNEVIEFYIDEVFLFTLKIEDGLISEFECSISRDVTYEIHITSDLISEVVASGGNLEDPIQFYKDKRASEDIVIKPHGIFKRLKLALLHFGLRFA